MMASEFRDIKNKLEQIQTKPITSCDNGDPATTQNNQKYTIYIEGLTNRKVIEINKNLTINNIVANLQLNTLTDYCILFGNRQLNGLDKIRDTLNNEATINLKQMVVKEAVQNK